MSHEWTPIPGDFYYGLPSQPRLLASTRPAVDFVPQSPFKTTPKHIYTFPSGHSIRPLWDTIIVPQLVSIIKAHDITGPACLDAVCIGPSEVEAVATVWIGVGEGALSSDTASSMVKEVKEFCVGMGAKHFEVEIRVTDVQRLTKFLDPESFPINIHKLADPFCYTLGTPISTAKYPNAIGTGGLLLSLPGYDKLYMLTARHVVDHDHRSRLDPSNVQDRTVVRIHTPTTFRDSRKELVARIETLTAMMNGYQRRLETAERMGREIPDTLRQSVSFVEAELYALTQWLHRLDTSFSSENDRSFGQTFAYPPIKFNVGPATSDANGVAGYTEDWCLLETDIQSDTGLVNHLSLLDIDDRTLALSRSDKSPIMDVDDDYLRIGGHLTQVDLESQSFAVLKNGATSSLTLGITNGLHSYWREEIAWSKELAVISLGQESSQSGLEYFSQGGDSGSTVIDRQGRVVGMMHAGCKRGKEVVWGQDGIKVASPTDITYVTPWWWLARRMREFGLVPTVV